MRFQSSQANCGPAALRNALQCHGVERAEAELETLTGCSAADGTSATGMIKALRLIAKDHPDIAPGVVHEGRDNVALLMLLETLRSGHVMILLVDDWEHWVVAFGLLGGGKNIRVHVSDSANSELVEHHTPATIMARWKGQGRKPYYGIVV